MPDTGRPLHAAERDGLRLELRLPDGPYLAGEVIQAEVLLQNVGTKPVSYGGVLVTIRDRQGQPADTGPGFFLAEFWMRIPFRPKDLAPGESRRETRLYRVPPQGADEHRFSAWATAVIWRRLDLPGGGSRLEGGPLLETGPIPLKIAAPTPAQRLRAELQADRQGWRLRVTDGLGQQPRGPFWGQLSWQSRHVRGADSLGPSTDGTWSGAWGDYLQRDGPPYTLTLWVGAPGYVSAAASTTVEGAVSRAD